MSRSLIPGEGRLPRPLDRLQGEMSNLFHRFFGDEGLGWANGGFSPLTNVAETDAAYEITTELPGVKPDDVKVEMLEGSLVISGSKGEEKEEEGKTFHRVERYTGEFRRVIALPPSVDKNKVKAAFKDGVLRVTVPKAEGAKPKSIAIKTE